MSSNSATSSEDDQKSDFFSNAEFAGRLPLVTKLRIRNFMCFRSLDLKSLNQTSIPYEGGGGDGKTAFVISMLLGLGYDCLLENEDTKTLCGFQIANVVRHGEATSVLETTISLQCSEHLMSMFGPYMTIQRIIFKGQPLNKSPIQLAASDSEGNCFEPKKRVTETELRVTLDILGISPKWFRLMLLDETNLTHLIHHPSEWYELYEQSFLFTKRKLLKDFLAFESHIEKMEGDLHWRLIVDNQLNTQLEQPFLVDSPITIRDRENDIRAITKIRNSMRAIGTEIDSCRSVHEICRNELEELHITFQYRISKIFRKFLNSQQLNGDVVIDLNQKKMAIWISNSSKESSPRTIDEAQLMWDKLPISRKKLAMTGLYLALWEVNESCPIFIVDSSSQSATEFKLPPPVFKIFRELMEEKKANTRTKHQQFFYTTNASSEVPLIELSD